MSFWKLIGKLTMMNAKTPGDLATGAFLVESENKKEEYRKQKKEEQKEIVIEWKNCLNCGAEVDINSKFCPNCGIEFKKSAPNIFKDGNVEFTFYDSQDNQIDTTKLNIYKPGFYKIGSKNISSGDYMFYSPTGHGYFCCGRGELSKKDLLPLDEEHEDGYYLNNLFETLKKDDCIYFENGYLINLNDFVKFKYNNRPGRSEFRVGIDIEPGKYILSPINSNYFAYFSIADEFSCLGKESPENYRVDENIELELFSNTILQISNNCIIRKK